MHVYKGLTDPVQRQGVARILRWHRFLLRAYAQRVHLAVACDEDMRMSKAQNWACYINARQAGMRALLQVLYNQRPERGQ